MLRISRWIAALALCVALPATAAKITVTSTDDTVTAADGKVTLREAIASINAGNDLGDSDIAAQNPGVYGAGDTIEFNIAGAGVHLITLGSSLPTITKQVFINGYAQPGSSPNTNAFNAGINAVLQIEIAGGAAVDPIFQILADRTEVRGLAIHGRRNIVGASDVVIAGNFFGTDATGTLDMGGSSDIFCLQIVSFGSTIPSRVTIGGTQPADRNLIVPGGGSGFYGTGVQLPFLPPGPGNDYVIRGNYIGTDISGTIALSKGNALNAISNALVYQNLISGNPGGAVQLLDNDVLQANLIGTARDGVGALPNGNFGGIEIHGGGSRVGNATAADAPPNVIAHNTGYGVVIYNASTQGSSNNNTRNQITFNSIHDNGRLGISLDYSSFVLANDPGDSDTWAANHVGNDGQNYPVLTAATISGGSATLSGSLNSLASNTYALQFFANAACDASGYGQGQTFIGSASVSTNASGDATFGPLVFSVPAGQAIITSTATDSAGNTSEFSKCYVAPSGLDPTVTTLASSLNPSMLGDTVTFTASVSGGATPTGNVQFKDNGVALGAPVALSAGQATVAIATLGVGTHPITAVYAGDAAHSPSTSAVLNQVVNNPALASTTTSLASSLNPSMFGQAVTFTAVVQNANLGGLGSSTLLTGTVQFKDGATALANVPLSGGSATFTTAALAVGAHPLTALYSGDAGNAPSTSPVLTQAVTSTVSAPAEPAPTLSQWMLLILLGVLGFVALRRLAVARR